MSLRHALRPLASYGARGALALWLGGTALLGAGLLSRHAVALPVPADRPATGVGLGAERLAGERGRWLAVHVLSTDCRCSERIARHLAEGPRPEGWTEWVLWGGDAPPPVDLSGRGFRVRRLTARQLAGLGIEAAPMLLALDPTDHVAYAGGYTERKQGPDIRDVALLSSARGATPATALPVFGCAVSDRLRAALASLPTP